MYKSKLTKMKTGLQYFIIGINIFRSLIHHHFCTKVNYL